MMSSKEINGKVEKIWEEEQKNFIMNMNIITIASLKKSQLKKFANFPKFIAGASARLAWKKPIVNETCTVAKYNALTDNKFIKIGDIVLDTGEKRQTTIKVNPINPTAWKEKKAEHIYIIVRNGTVMKIGGTRTGMKNRFGSYLCGHCVPERIMKRTGKGFPGKMSVTNAYLYHTIEDDLLNGGNWEFWSWKLPTVTVSVDILGVPALVIAQTYHAYESRCIELFRQLTTRIPQLCNNADPNYR